MAENAEEVEETHLDRLKKYRALVAGGMLDKDATEKVWPSTTANMVKNAKEKSDKKDADKATAGKNDKKEKGKKKD